MEFFPMLWSENLIWSVFFYQLFTIVYIEGSANIMKGYNTLNIV